MKKAIGIRHLYYLWILILVGFFLIFKYSPLNGDSLLAWPISLKIFDPKLFNPNDLLLNAAESTPFIFYKILGGIPIFQDNYPLRDVLIYFPLIFLQALGWFLVFNLLTKNSYISMMSLIVLFFSDSKLGLHWSYTPFPGLVSYSAIHFMHIFSLYFYLKEKIMFSGALLGIASFIHPATSLGYFIVGVCGYSYKKRWRELSLFMSLFLVFFLPNYFLNLQGVSYSIDKNKFFEIYEMFQYHAYVKDHLQEGYIFFLMSLVLISTQSKSILEEFNKLKLLLVFSLIGCVAWLLNLYWTKILSIVYFYFPMRIFYLIKPLIILQLIQICFEKLKDVKEAKPNAIVLNIFLSFLVMKTFFSFTSFQASFVLLTYTFYLSNRMKGVLIGLVLFVISLMFKTSFEVELVIFSSLALATLFLYFKRFNEFNHV